MDSINIKEYVFIIFLVSILINQHVHGILHFKINGTLGINETVGIICLTKYSNKPYWIKYNTNPEIILVQSNNSDPSQESSISDINTSTLWFHQLGFENFGNYTCRTKDLTRNYELKVKTDHIIRTELELFKEKDEEVNLICVVIGYPIDKRLIWMKNGTEITNSSQETPIYTTFNLTSVSSNIKIENVTYKHNGTYSCQYGNKVSTTELVVLGPPDIKADLLKVVGKSKIFLNWTFFDGNNPLYNIELFYYETDLNQQLTSIIPANSNSFILEDLKPLTTYSNFSLIARNKFGTGTTNYNVTVLTLKEDPVFIPIINIKGSSQKSVDIAIVGSKTEYFQYFRASIKSDEEAEKIIKFYENPYMIENLSPGTNYTIKVRACSEFTEECDEYSTEVSALTMDGISSPPINLHMNCYYNSSTRSSALIAIWRSPLKPQGTVTEYVATLFGNMTYKVQEGLNMLDEIGPIEKTVTNTQVEFSGQPPNTFYYLTVCAKTRSRACGEKAIASCYMPPSPPSQQEFNRVTWKHVFRDNQFFFMINLPYISQRNGSVCCFRLIIVRLSEISSFHNLETPEKLKLLTYEQAHNRSSGGAYVAEIIHFNDQSQRIVLLGDGKPGKTSYVPSCNTCMKIFTQGIVGNFRRTHSLQKKKHRKRHTSSEIEVYDGPLQPESVYTAFIEAIVDGGDKSIIGRSDYFAPLKLSNQLHTTVNSWSLDNTSLSTLLLGTVVMTIISTFLAIVCIMKLKNKEPSEQNCNIFYSWQNFCTRIRGNERVPNENFMDIPPILKENLVSAYLERHNEGDIGFQQEFENLPDKFLDRTSHESDKRENSGKNRYPDIKAFDQTRVRLTSIDNGSNYINANYVFGYKERKKFICAQGPMDSTLTDWWRMIWEQHVSIILMLTNIEEYNKPKCAKYWPAQESEEYGDIRVTHVSEQKFSDFLIRNFSLKQSRFIEQEEEERHVQQYHYLEWKDFSAPEHPTGILRFIKQFNNDYCNEKSPVLVHCSAGVGRTGTFVALDSLLQQLKEENSVSVFNTVCELRHQRNYLVQSLKQYIFIYRALMEASQFKDTEIKITELKGKLEEMKTCEDENSNEILAEFKNLSAVIEDRKSFAVATSEENLCRNRHKNVLPYDRNRVILSPMPSSTNEICTYINASFIEGYTNKERIILTQDPLDKTIADFWRMIVEQDIKTVVMLSEVGMDQNCPRYWPEKDQETMHSFIKVKYMQSQSFPFYYKREFMVTNTKSTDSFLVTQFQYNGWPLGTEEVPESTRGMVELVDTTLKHQDNSNTNTNTLIVHCSDGAQRSCIFVALTILVKQMVSESRIDVFNVIRKLRSQRQNLFQNLTQYEFVYRGLLTYFELHVDKTLENF